MNKRAQVMADLPEIPMPSLESDEGLQTLHRQYNQLHTHLRTIQKSGVSLSDVASLEALVPGILTEDYPADGFTARRSDTNQALALEANGFAVAGVIAAIIAAALLVIRKIIKWWRARKAKANTEKMEDEIVEAGKNVQTFLQISHRVTQSAAVNRITPAELNQAINRIARRAERLYGTPVNTGGDVADINRQVNELASHGTFSAEILKPMAIPFYMQPRAEQQIGALAGIVRRLETAVKTKQTEAKMLEEWLLETVQSRGQRDDDSLPFHDPSKRPKLSVAVAETVAPMLPNHRVNPQHPVATVKLFATLLYEQSRHQDADNQVTLNEGARVHLSHLLRRDIVGQVRALGETTIRLYTSMEKDFDRFDKSWTRTKGVATRVMSMLRENGQASSYDLSNALGEAMRFANEAINEQADIISALLTIRQIVEHMAISSSELEKRSKDMVNEYSSWHAATGEGV